MASKTKKTKVAKKSKATTKSRKVTAKKKIATKKVAKKKPAAKKATAKKATVKKAPVKKAAPKKAASKKVATPKAAIKKATTPKTTSTNKTTSRAAVKRVTPKQAEVAAIRSTKLPRGISNLFAASKVGDPPRIEAAVGALSSKLKDELMAVLPWATAPGEKIIQAMQKLGRDYKKAATMLLNKDIPPTDVVLKCCLDSKFIGDFREMVLCLCDYCECSPCWPCKPPWICRCCYGMIRVYPKSSNFSKFICATSLKFKGDVTVQQVVPHQAEITVNGGESGGPHAATHQAGGSDCLNVNGLSGVLADAQPPAPHDHNANYASISHNHSGTYAPASHDHDSDYASVSHDHSGTYAPASHDHDSDYASVSHDHSGIYSPVGHDHSGTYSPVGHDHSGTYAPTSHDHDSDYYTQDEIDTTLENRMCAVAHKIEYTSTSLPLNFTGITMPTPLAGANASNTLVIASGSKIEDSTGHRTPLAISGTVVNPSSVDLQVWDSTGTPYNMSSWYDTYSIEITFAVVKIS